MVIMYVETFRTDIIAFNGNIMCFMAHRLIILSIRVSPLILKISPSKINGKMYKLQIKSFTGVKLMTVTIITVIPRSEMADVESGKNLFCRLNCFYNVF
jgi:hypothetical protein